MGRLAIRKASRRCEDYFLSTKPPWNEIPRHQRGRNRLWWPILRDGLAPIGKRDRHSAHR